MNFSINLARRPAENLRRTWVIWGGLLAVCFAVFLLLTTATAAGLYERFRADREVANLHRDMIPLEAREAELYAQVQADPRMRATLDRSAYLNRLIDHKAISWTHLFERLEALMPAQVQLMTLRPGTQGGETDVTMTVAAANLDQVTEFVRKLERAPDFAEPEVERYSGAAPSEMNGPPKVLMQITARYNPHALPAVIERPTERASGAGHEGDVPSEAGPVQDGGVVNDPAEAGEDSTTDANQAGLPPAETPARPQARPRAGGPR
jgi:Tfp pilus assembly protein PilN